MVRYICATEDGEEVEIRGTKGALASFVREFIGNKITRCRSYSKNSEDYIGNPIYKQ
jgi:hypothetical protein